MKTTRANPFRRSGFTIMELLIVVCIIGILAGLVIGSATKLVGSAVEKRNKANAARLRAAIVEYWHDMGKWPVPDDATPRLASAGKLEASYGDESGDEETVYKYLIVYDIHNDVVVGKLLDAELPTPDGGKKISKTFIDLHGFSTPTKTNPTATDVFVPEVSDAWEVRNGSARDEDGAPVPARSDTVLCFFTKAMQCPHCEGWTLPSTTECPNDGCPFLGDAANDWRKDKFRYRFTKEDRNKARAVGCPFTITFDLDNNDVRVEAKLKTKAEDVGAGGN
jgi:prepilin-type N-terminal cleavage/methylation domain-containing protein